MKRVLLSGVVIATLTLLGGLAIPVLAHGPEDGKTAPAEQKDWEAMHEACEDGDWEAMDEAAEEVHREDFASMPCHDEGDYAPSWRDGMGGGWGGMM